MHRLFVAVGLTFGLLASPVLAQDMDLFPMADADSDGKITLAEYTTFHETGWGFFTNGSGVDKLKLAELPLFAKSAFTGVTPDANGEVTKAAYLAAAPAQFKAADKNGDGTLDRAEFAAMMQPPA